MWVYDTVFDRFTDIIKWRMTYDCNYSCQHCTQTVNHCAQRHDAGCDLERTAAEINSFLRDTPTQILLIGGEPSLLDLHKILEAFTKDVTFHLTTNFSQPAEWYNSLFRKYPKFEICCSFHDQITDWASFSEKFRALEISGKRIEFCVTNGNHDLIASCAAECRTEGIDYKVDYDIEGGAEYKDYEKIPSSQFTRLRTSEGDFVTKGEFVKQFCKIREYDSKGSARAKLLPFRGLPCSVGQHSLYIIGNKITTCNGMGKTTADFKWNEEPNVCKYAYCGDLSCISLCIGAEAQKILAAR